MFKKHLPLIVRCKVYVDRGRSYMAYISATSIIAVAVNSFGGQPAEILDKHPIPIMFIGMILLYVLLGMWGWVDTHFGLFQHESSRISDLNPTYAQILEKLDKLIAIEEEKANKLNPAKDFNSMPIWRDRYKRGEYERILESRRTPPEQTKSDNL